MTGPVLIRPVAPDDFDAWLPLWNGYNRFYGRAARAKRVYWLTHETNATAMRLYDGVAERSGFVVYRKAL
jgi:hypothetical protein